MDDINITHFTKEMEKVAHVEIMISELKEQIKPFKVKIKELEIQKKELEQDLCPIMEANDYKKAELPGGIGVIQYSTKNSVIPLNQKSISEKMKLFFRNGPGSKITFNSMLPEQKGTAMYEYIYSKENREYIKKDALKFKSN